MTKTTKSVQWPDTEPPFYLRIGRIFSTNFLNGFNIRNSCGRHLSIASCSETIVLCLSEAVTDSHSKDTCLRPTSLQICGCRLVHGLLRGGGVTALQIRNSFWTRLACACMHAVERSDAIFASRWLLHSERLTPASETARNQSRSRQ